MKETIAFVNNKSHAGVDLMKELAQQDFQVLCILEDEESPKELTHTFGAAASRIEIVTCPREGCWEADIIIFRDSRVVSDELIQRIQKVATQKIILRIESEESTSNAPEPGKLEEAFPFSMVAVASIYPSDKKAEIAGKNQNALNNVATVFKKAGYSTFVSEI